MFDIIINLYIYYGFEVEFVGDDRSCFIVVCVGEGVYLVGVGC